MKPILLISLGVIAGLIVGFLAGLFYNEYEASSYSIKAIEAARTTAANETKKVYEEQIAEMKASGARAIEAARINAVDEAKKLYEGQIAELRTQVQRPEVPTPTNAPTDQPPPSQMYLRAEQIRALTPAEAVSLLRQNLLWANISYDAKEEMILLKARDGSDGFIQYSRGGILFLRLTLPRKTTPPASALPMIGIQVPGPPTQTWQYGVRWESGFGVFKMVDAISNEKITMLGVDYVEESVIKQWESEGLPPRGLF